jgi:hypothetical protein
VDEEAIACTGLQSQREIDIEKRKAAEAWYSLLIT